ncbi:ribonuclease HII [Fluviibacter phosphoraccumulans]|uniref:Ribonuclease HII n=1 Tax=Fluviibacter phosphoraccumulans TaxID=1751046 RepID=A0A7R6TQM1_9RHOO|nr:ribonuclease HII [Fluviibacter phosphoraccumulans]BBU69578.1 ribonuclease HII [Fluviibacter phosphoraccumulans]BBU71239.1 ribonuclease HII [Fluviibacter phosphoraccumulans]
MIQHWVCGVDEAGRGPLAGAVVAAAVILDPERPIAGLADSKKLRPAVRERLAIEIREKAIAWSVAEASALEIDQINILQATFLAMRRAIEGLPVVPAHALIDGNRVPPGLRCTAEAIVKGDAKEAAISAASILAKTVRDAQLIEMDALYPEYGFAKHMGYPTPVHLAALKQYGPTPEHRRTFGPVAQCMLLGTD